MFTIDIPKREKKIINKLPANLRGQIDDAIKALAKDPRPMGCLKLANAKDMWRIRVQNYRIGYSIDERRQIVTVEVVAHRNEFYPKGGTH